MLIACCLATVVGAVAARVLTPLFSASLFVAAGVGGLLVCLHLPDESARMLAVAMTLPLVMLSFGIGMGIGTLARMSRPAVEPPAQG